MRLVIIGTHLFYGPNRLPFSLFWLVVVQFLPDNEPENLWSRAHILALKHFRKCAMIPGKLACDPCQSVFSFLPWRALVKTMVLEAMRILSYFRLDTLTTVHSFVLGLYPRFIYTSPVASTASWLSPFDLAPIIILFLFLQLNLFKKTVVLWKLHERIGKTLMESSVSYS